MGTKREEIYEGGTKGAVDAHTTFGNVHEFLLILRVMVFEAVNIVKDYIRYGNFMRNNTKIMLCHNLV